MPTWKLVHFRDYREAELFLNGSLIGTTNIPLSLPLDGNLDIDVGGGAVSAVFAPGSYTIQEILDTINLAAGVTVASVRPYSLGGGIPVRNLVLSYDPLTIEATSDPTVLAALGFTASTQVGIAPSEINADFLDDGGYYATLYR